MSDPIRVVLVDDHAVVRLGLRAYFGTLADIEVVGEAGTGEEAVNPFTELTERELDVLRQVAAGKSNHEIAAALVIGESTVKSHIANILAKLHLADRTQAAVYAWREGIVRRDHR